MTLAKYFLVLEETLETRLRESRDDLTYFQRLQRHLPQLSKAEYAERHKKILEYIVRKGKARLSRFTEIS